MVFEFQVNKKLEWLCNFAEVVTKFLQVNRVKSDHGDLDHVKAVGRLAFFRDSYALELMRKISKYSLQSLKQTCKIFAQYLKLILEIINFIEVRLTM